MDPEFKAFIHAVAPECAAARRRRQVRVFFAGFKTIAASVAKVIEELGPYYCELQPMRRLRDACARTTRQAIGFHGLL